jgi:hypothetical protein
MLDQQASFSDPSALDAALAALGLPFTAEVEAGLAQFTSDRPALGRFSIFGTKRRTEASVHASRERLAPEDIAAIRRRAAPLGERVHWSSARGTAEDNRECRTAHGIS